MVSYWSGDGDFSATLYVALSIQNTMRKRNIVICDLRGCAVFFHIISWKVQFKKSYLI